MVRRQLNVHAKNGYETVLLLTSFVKVDLHNACIFELFFKAAFYDRCLT